MNIEQAIKEQAEKQYKKVEIDFTPTSIWKGATTFNGKIEANRNTFANGANWLLTYLKEKRLINEWVSFYQDYVKWSHSTFGTDTPIHGLTKLITEAQEAKESPNDMTEYADCLMCLFYAFSCAFPDKTMNDLIEAANKKLEKNKNRTWVKQPDGTWQHTHTISTSK